MPLIRLCEFPGLSEFLLCAYMYITILVLSQCSSKYPIFLILFICERLGAIYFKLNIFFFHFVLLNEILEGIYSMIYILYTTLEGLGKQMLFN